MCTVIIRWFNKLAHAREDNADNVKISMSLANKNGESFVSDVDRHSERLYGLFF